MSTTQTTMQRIQQKLREAIARALEKIGVPSSVDVFLEVPREAHHGDWATNVAMQLAKSLRKPPHAIARAIVDALDAQQAGVARVEIAGPGFINFVMDKRALHDVIRDVYRAGARYGALDRDPSERILVEYVSANPTGQLHLGHARGAALGDALCRVLAYAGYTIEREYYINDAGNQITNWAQSLEVRYCQALGIEREMPEDGYFGDDVVAYGKRIALRDGDQWVRADKEVRAQFFRQYGLERQMEAIRGVLHQFRVQFDHWRSETALYERGDVQRALDALRTSGCVYEHDGAIWLQTTAFGDDKDRVLVKQDGLFTYLMPDIAYHIDKYERGYDKIINIWGADHHGYVARVRAAMQAVGRDPDVLHVVIAQMVSLYKNGEKVKMSKRTGKAITLAELIDDVGVDAARYFFAMRSADAHLDFDMDLAVSESSDNPVYYVQYAHARICSVFRQAGVSEEAVRDADLTPLSTDDAYALLQVLGAWPEAVAEAAQQCAPHRVVRYVYGLAGVFHRYYKAERVLVEDDKERMAKLALYGATRRTIAAALDLIGVHAPTVMVRDA
jgi:arginyl-tRNA synthetase